MASHRRTLIAVLLVIVVGLLLRVATLDCQSLWFDEAHWVCKMVEAPSLAAWLHQSDDANRDMVPFYFILQYFWYHYLFSSMVGMRCLSVLIGMLLILLTYQFGRELYGARAGLLAALCCALSPLQIYYAQELRPYGLLALLGLLAVYALHAALYRGGTRWWILNIVVNSLLMWTHLFGLWLIVTEGFFLLLFHFWPFRRLLLWGIVNAVLMIPVLMLVLTWTHPGEPPIEAPWIEIVTTWLCLDGFQLVFLVYYRTLSSVQDLFTGLPAFLAAAFPWMVITFSLVLLGGAVCRPLQIRRNQRAGGGIAGDEAAAERQTVLLLWMWYALPALWIWLFSVLVVPAFQQRYVIYSCPALYILAAGGILGMRAPWKRYAWTVLLVVALGVTALLEVVLPVRPDYVSACRYVQSEVKEEDAVLWQPALTRDTFAFNLNPDLSRVEPAGQIGMREEFAGIEAALGQRKDVWVLHGLWHMDCARTRSQILERYLALRNIAYSKRTFPGRWDIVVYHCAWTPDYAPIDAPQESSRLVQSLARFETDDAPLRWLICQCLERAGRFTEAAEIRRKELEAIPPDAGERVVLSLDLWRLGWDDRLFDGGGYADLYIADIFKSWVSLLQADGLDGGDVALIEAYGRRFPDNADVAAACASVRNAVPGADSGTPGAGTEGRALSQ